MSATSVQLRQRLKKNPSSYLYARLADTLREEGAFDDALPVVEAGLAQYPDHVTGLLVKSRLLLDINENEEAVQVLGRIIEREPCCLSARIMLGDVFTRLGRTAEAQIQIAWLKDLDPLGPTIRIKGNISTQMETPQEASIAQRDLSLALDNMFGEEDTESIVPDIAKEEKEIVLKEDNDINSGDVAAALDLALSEESITSQQNEYSSDFNLKETLQDSIEGSDVGSAIDAMFGEGEDIPDTISSLQSQTQTVNQSEEDELARLDPSAMGDDVGAAIDALFGESETKVEDSNWEIAKEKTPAPKPWLDTDESNFEKTPINSPTSEEIDKRSSLFQEAEVQTAPDLESSSISNDADSIFDLKNPPRKSAHAADLETRLSSAFDDLFGNEDLPEDEFNESELLSSSASASESVNAPEKVESQLSKKISGLNEDFKDNVGEAFDNLFGDNSQENELDSDSEPMTGVPEFSIEQAEEGSVAVENSPMQLVPAVESSPEKVFGEMDFISDKLDTEETFEIAEKEPEAAKPTKTEETLEKGVASALDALFGEDDDDFLENQIAQEKTGVQNSDDLLAPSPTLTLADIYLGQNLPGEALLILRQLQQRDPDNIEVTDRINRIQEEHPDLDEEEDGRTDLDNPRPRMPRPGPRKR